MRYLFVCVIFIGSVKTGHTQNAASSPYSAYGMGFLNDNTSALNRALGGTGIGLIDGSHLNRLNPASYVWINTPISHVYEFSIYGEHNNFRTSAQRESSSTGGLNNMAYWFKFKPEWASAVGIAPFSTVSYNVTTTKMLASSEEADYQYKGTGNTTQLYFTNAFKIGKDFSAGVNISYIFGSINRSETVSGTAFTDALILNDKIFSNKFSIDYGLQYKVDLPLMRSLSFGVIYQHPLTFKGKSEITLYNSANDTLKNGNGDRVTYGLPAKFGLGAAFIDKRYTIAADIQFRNWSAARYSNLDARFQDTWRYSLGLSYRLSKEPESYLGTVTLYGGAYFQQHYLRLDGNDLPNYGFSIGTGIPVLDGKSTIRLTYNYDNFGTLNDNLILQRSQRLSLDIIIRDLWGYRRKFD